ncbi:MAG: Clp protease N-terminal domain-containing protein [Aggregatilineales bacterium]
MANIGLKHILISARQESYKMRHFYVGAEHLFIALLEIKGGLASSIVQKHGLTPEYVIDSVRRKIGKGSRHRLWAGVPNTPRADVLLDIARDIAMESGRDEIDERDLLTAILEEDDSIPVRVLHALGIEDTHKIVESIYNNEHVSTEMQTPYVEIETGAHFEDSEQLSKEHLYLIRRMFYGYPKIRLERRLMGGYTSAVLLVITPLHGDNREDASVVIKIDHTDAILDETRRYESFVKRTLPPLTARLEDRPVAPDNMDIAGIKYTLIAGNDRIPHDLRAILVDWEPAQLGSWVRNELFPAFGRIWWRQSRPYRFQVWQEYDWLLPPILTLEYTGDKQLPSDGYTVKFPVKRSKLSAIDYGDVVAIENFTVRKTYPERNAIQLAAGQGSDAAQAYKIEIRNLDFEKDTYYRGEVIDSIIGTVWQTRSQQLMHSVRALEPDFNPDLEKIPFTPNSDLERLPNPLFAYEELLDTYINGSLSTIHGDLHLGNIMIGPNNSAFLIDFAHSRDGHTLFDWAMLEISLLREVVMPIVSDSWDDARLVLTQLRALNQHQFVVDDTPLHHALSVIVEVRKIVEECLAREDRWSEYYIALALTSLRAISWEAMSVGSRRFMFLLCALSVHEVRANPYVEADDSFPPDATDIGTNY